MKGICKVIIIFRLMPVTWSYLSLEERRCLAKTRYGCLFVEALAVYSRINWYSNLYRTATRGSYQGISLGKNKEIIP